MAAMLTNFAPIGVLLTVRIVRVVPSLTAHEFHMIFTRLGCTAERVFRVDSGQEHLHYITDISTDCLYILDPVSSVDTESHGYNY